MDIILKAILLQHVLNLLILFDWQYFVTAAAKKRPVNIQEKTN